MHVLMSDGDRRTKRNGRTAWKSRHVDAALKVPAAGGIMQSTREEELNPGNFETNEMETGS